MAEGKPRGQGALPRPAAPLCSRVSHSSWRRGQEHTEGACHGDRRLPGDSSFSGSAAACLGLEAPAPRSGRSLLAAACPPTQSPPRLSLGSLLPPRFPIRGAGADPGPPWCPQPSPAAAGQWPQPPGPAPPAQQAAAPRMEPLGVKGGCDRGAAQGQAVWLTTAVQPQEQRAQGPEGIRRPNPATST